MPRKRTIASRTYTLIKGNEATKLTVTLGVPFPIAEGEWQCEYQIDDTKRTCHGVDAFQCLQLVMVMIGSYLEALRVSDGFELRWGNDEPTLGFPLGIEQTAPQ